MKNNYTHIKNLHDKIDLDIYFSKMKIEILEHIKTLNINTLHEDIVKSNTYDMIKQKFNRTDINFEANFLKILGDTVNEVLYYSKL